MYNCKRIPLTPKSQCQLFDSFVGSILGYGSEIWGYTKSKEIERIYLKILKRLLTSTSTAGVYGELGRFPLFINRYVRIIKYWCKICNSDNSLIKTMYKVGLDNCNNGCKNWVDDVNKCFVIMSLHIFLMNTVITV